MLCLISRLLIELSLKSIPMECISVLRIAEKRFRNRDSSKMCNFYTDLSWTVIIRSWFAVNFLGAVVKKVSNLFQGTYEELHQQEVT